MTVATARAPLAPGTVRQPVRDRRGGEALHTAPVEPALRVLLITEGTYPFYFGGVSTWCHGLVKSLPEVDFSLLSIIDAPDRQLRFELADNVVDFRPTPLWGVRGPADLVAGPAVQALARRRRASTPETVQRDLAPWLRSFVELLLIDEADPADLAEVVHGLYRFFIEHDFDTVMRSEAAWDAVTGPMVARTAELASAHGFDEVPVALSDLTEAMGLVRAWLAPLAHELPQVDVAHAAMAGIPALVAVAAKQDQNASFMLTEHGIFLRERLLAEAGGDGSLFLKLLRLRFALRTTELSYALADRVAPCCDNHQRWELRIGARPEVVSTIYYGVDATVFKPEAREVGAPPTVVWVGRIDPLKDVETLLRAAAVVHRSRPDVIFRVYGAALPGSEDYHRRCMDLRAELGLEDVVRMEGYTSSPTAAFNQGDLVALSSISEGFPYSTLEAMLCSKAIVATSVGGIAEQVAGCGRVVEPRNPEQFGAAILELMADPITLAELGKEARAHAEALFSRERERQAHLDAYVDMTRRSLPQQATNHSSEGRSGHLAGALGSLLTKLRVPAPDSLDLAALARAWRRGGPTWKAAQPEPIPQSKAPAGGDLASEPLDALVEEVRARVPLPVHVLELAAVLESCGVTDEVARRHGVADVFELAKLVLAELRREPGRRVASSHVPPAGQPAVAVSRSWMRWLGLAVPSAAVVAIGPYLRATGLTTSRGAMDVLAGLLAGFFLSTVCMQGLAPRASLYIGCRNPRLGRRLVTKYVVAASVGTCAAAAVALAISWSAGWGSPTDRMLITAAFVAGCLYWLAASGLVVAQALPMVGAVTAAGAVVVVATDRALAPATSAHGLLGLAVGYFVTVGLLIGLSRRRLAGGPDGRIAADLPPARRLAGEAAPHAVQAALVLCLLAAPHVAVWLSSGGGGRAARLTALELGLNVALLPLLTASTIVERTASLYWHVAREAQISIPGRRSGDFSHVLTGFFGRRRVVDWAYLGLASIVVAAAFGAVLGLGWSGPLVAATDHGAALQTAVGALVGGALLGAALFDAAAASTLGGLPAIMRCFVVALGVAAATVVVVVMWGDATAAPVVLILGAGAAAIGCRRVAKRTLRRAPHAYYSSL